METPLKWYFDEGIGYTNARHNLLPQTQSLISFLIRLIEMRPEINENRSLRVYGALENQMPSTTGRVIDMCNLHNVTNCAGKLLVLGLADIRNSPYSNGLRIFNAVRIEPYFPNCPNHPKIAVIDNYNNTTSHNPGELYVFD